MKNLYECTWEKNTFGLDKSIFGLEKNTFGHSSCLHLSVAMVQLSIDMLLLLENTWHWGNLLL